MHVLPNVPSMFLGGLESFNAFALGCSETGHARSLWVLLVLSKAKGLLESGPSHWQKNLVC